ncbi:MAG: DUF349 domain-containing protein [Proteobacteria bacterium]|nr:DUF349 domain-containing protein [Pseudomonadota bacterium]
MKLARWLFKPKWQDKDARIRRAAIQSDDADELIVALPQIVRNDPDAEVRLAAIKRLNDYEIWRERSTGDADATVRNAAREGYLRLLCSNDANLPTLTRRIAELETLSTDELERIATSALDRDLRAAALERVTRPAVIAECAVRDSDAGIRLAALERVGDAAALARIAERTRKTDKAVNRRARELIDAQRIGSGDAATIAHKARLLCQRLEALVRTPADGESEQAAIMREWDALGQAIPVELQARYCGADALVRQARINAQNPVAPIAPAPIEDDSPVSQASPVEMSSAQIGSATAQAQVAADAQHERELRRGHLREIEAILPQYMAVLEAGTVSTAHGLHDRLLNLTSMVVPLPVALEAKLTPLHAQYLDLKQQQIWANHRRREMLCEDIEHLAQAGLHPDALALRVREAREEWRRLDDAEGVSGQAGTGFGKRFQAICQQTLRPAMKYFEKRSELRKARADDVETLLQRTAALPETLVDWKSADALRRQLGEALRTLDAVDPRSRTELARRIKTAIGELSPRIDAHVGEVVAAKNRLIARAQSLQTQSDARTIAREARDLQQHWTALGQGRRGSDQKQWQEFRGALDAAFGKLDDARKQRDETVAIAREQAERLIAQVIALDDGLDSRFDSANAQLRELDTNWHALSPVDKALDQRYRHLRDIIDGKLRDVVRRKRISRFTAAMEKFALLRAVETSERSGPSIAARWSELSVAGEFSSALDARLARIETHSKTPGDDDVARELLVELEFLAGIETPREDRQLRMNFQVQRLASHMRDRSSATPETELARLMCSWFSGAPQSVALEQRFIRATAAAIETLP